MQEEKNIIKETFTFFNNKSRKCEIDQEVDLDNKEIKFQGTIKFTKDTKTNRRIMYRCQNGELGIPFILPKETLRVTNAEIDEIYRDIEDEYNVDLH